MKNETEEQKKPKRAKPPKKRRPRAEKRKKAKKSEKTKPKTGTQAPLPEEEPAPDPSQIRQRRRSNALERRSKDRQEAEKALLGEKQEVFRRRLDEASDDRAPVTRRYRGYYPFSRDYPSLTDENGFRENAPRRHRWTAPVALTLVFALLFCLAFVVTRRAQLISAEKPAGETDTVAPISAEAPRTLHFTYEELRLGDADALKKKLEAAGADTALFEYKTQEGYLLFPGLPIFGENADLRVPDAYQAVAALKGAGYQVGAYVCCFRDRVAAEADPSLGVLRDGEDGRRLWRDNASSPWLNPFSAEARTYLLDAVKAAAEEFDLIVLDCVCFPTDAGLAAPVFEGETDYPGTRNQLLMSFLSEAVRAAGRARIALIGGVEALSPDADETLPPCYGSMRASPAGVYFADARPSFFGRNVTVGTQTFASPASLPFPFVLAVGERAGELCGDDALRFGLCVDRGAALEEELAAAAFTDATRVLIW